MATREVRIDGVTGNPIGGSHVGYADTYTTGSNVYGNVAATGASYGLASGSQGYTTGATQGYTTGVAQGYTTGAQGYTTTSSYQPATTTYTTTTNTYQQPQTVTYNNAAYGVASGGYGASSGYISQGATVVQGQQSQIVNTTVNTGKQVIKGESRIEYVPFEKKIIEYKDQSRVERVPKTRRITEYKQEKRIEEVPREVTITDYYAVEYLRQYIPQYIPEKEIQYVAKERKVKKYEYIPVERQIVHYPETPLEAEVSGGAYQGSSAGYHSTTGQTVTYAPSTVGYQSGVQSVGYQGGVVKNQVHTYGVGSGVGSGQGYTTGGYTTGGYTTGGYTTGGAVGGGGYSTSGYDSGYGGETVSYGNDQHYGYAQPGTSYVSSSSGVRKNETVTYTTTSNGYQGGSYVPEGYHYA